MAMRPRLATGMNYNPALHHRRSIRLPDYDYRQAGAYFVTLVTYGRDCLFGQIIEDEICLNVLGEIVEEEWRRTGEIRREILMGSFIVMPNHVHGIIVIASARDCATAEGGASTGAHSRAPLQPPAPQSPRLSRSLGSVVAGLKSAVTKRINLTRGTPGLPVWQRNYYERVIRNEEEMNRLHQYIVGNPSLWKEDSENPAIGPS